MTEVPKNLVTLDSYRKDWTAGIINCSLCRGVYAHLWITGASVTYCPGCNQLTDLVINREV